MVATACAAIGAAVGNFFVNFALVPDGNSLKSMKKKKTDKSETAVGRMDMPSLIDKNKERASKYTKFQLEHAQKKNLHIQSKRGQSLHAYKFVKIESDFTEKEQNPWVILVHGYKGDSHEMFDYAAHYIAWGYQVLIPDLVGHGESDGKFVGMGWTDRLDLIDWISYILKEDANASIVLHGHSMGGAAVLMTAGESLPDNVKAVIADCPYTSVWSMFSNVLKSWFHLPAFPSMQLSNLIFCLRGGYDLRKADTIKQVKKSKIPIFFIHGLEDKFIPYEMTVELYNAATCQKDLMLVEGAGHVQSEYANPKQYFKAVKSFIDECMTEDAI